MLVHTAATFRTTARALRGTPAVIVRLRPASDERYGASEALRRIRFQPNPSTSR